MLLFSIAGILTMIPDLLSFRREKKWGEGALYLAAGLAGAALVLWYFLRR